MILMVDNYDSFTYNLVQYLGELGEDLSVFRNDKITIQRVKRLKPEKIIISPGPGRPKDAGISCELIKKFYRHTSILGVCLGHQCIAEVFGADIVRADRLMHGKTSLIYHSGGVIFKNIESPFEAMRYHSLMVANDTRPEILELAAWTDRDEIMALKHKNYPLWGLQFHPESILTKSGKKILKNFLSINI